MADNKRKRRIEESIKREIGRLLLVYPKQSVFNKITITAVDVAPDLSKANVFFSLFDDVDVVAATKTLREEAKFFRKTLARTLNLRLTPRLDFIYDESIKHGSKLSKLIDDAIASDENVNL